MAARSVAPEDLTALLQQLRLQQADGSTPSEVTQAQIELLLARMAALTQTVRGAAESTETFRVAARLLLADIAMVTAQFRGNTNVLSDRLTNALENARLALNATPDTPAPEQ